MIEAINLGTEAAIGNIPSLVQPTPTAAPGGSFGAELGQQIKKLDDIQRSADTQAQLFATGQAKDVTEVVLAAERAQLALQLGAQIRNRTVEAYHEIMRTQV